MTIQLAAVTFDCNDAAGLAGFWAEALGRSVDDGASPFYATIGSDSAEPTFMFLQVPEHKSVKNRCHPDLTVDSRDAVHTEAERLRGIGATMIREPAEEFGFYWATLLDPEGNEFCLGHH